MYTVTIQTEITDGEVVSRFFETKKAALRWFKWLTNQKMTLRSSLYRGEAGAELLERFVASSGPVDVSTVTEYGLTQKLSNSIRCF